MKNLNWWLIKIDRLSAWILLFGMFAYFISGYGMTKGLITGDFARWLHLDFFPMIVLVTFALHAGLAIRVAFIRWRIHNWFSMLVLFLIFASFLIGFAYVELYYKTPAPALNQPIVQVQPNPQAPTVPTTKTFTLAELAQYNGLNGMPAYAAVDGTVYDLSSVFRNGVHQGYAAGLDQTAAFYSQHMKQILSKFPVVAKTSSTTF